MASRDGSADRWELLGHSGDGDRLDGLWGISPDEPDVVGAAVKEDGSLSA